MHAHSLMSDFWYLAMGGGQLTERVAYQAVLVSLSWQEGTYEWSNLKDKGQQVERVIERAVTHLPHL